MIIFTAVDMLKNSADKYPQQIALKDEKNEITYLGLKNKSELLGKCLLQHGVKKGDRVGIFKDNSVNTVIAIMGIMYAGAAFVCINTKLKSKQVNFIIDDSGIKIIVSNRHKIKYFFNAIKRDSVKLIDIDMALEDDKDYSSAMLTRIIDTDMASLIYTSGSTGKPKGVIFTHKEIVMCAKIMAELFNNTSGDNILCTLPFSADYGLTLLYTMLLVGGKLTILNSFFPNDIVNALITERITGFSGITPIWPILFSEKSLFPSKDFANLKYITIGGGYPSDHIMKKIMAKFEGKTDIYMLYGLTEASWSTCLRPDKLKKKYGSIGTPVPNVEVYVIRKDGKICAPGEEGELVHRGGVVAKGYWKDQDKTDKIFKYSDVVPEHLRKEEKVVYSGDIVTVDKEGYFYFKTRGDDQIKVQGYRVCSNDIIDSIYETDIVESCCIFGVPAGEKGSDIIACIKPKEKEKNIKARVTAHLEKELPSYMVPLKIFVLKDLPLTPSYKIDVLLLKSAYVKNKLADNI